MNNSDPANLFLATSVMFFIAILYATYQRDCLKEEAVERGYAEWVVDPSGETKWKWKEAQQ